MPELILEAGRAEQNYWRSLWRYRELFYFLAWRDILVRYKQTLIGIAWAVLRPFLTMLVFTFVFHRIANLQAPGGLPYALFVFAAMLPWQFFATALSESSASLHETALLSEAALAEDWNRPEEDAAWSHLQQGRSSECQFPSPICRRRI